MAPLGVTPRALRTAREAGRVVQLVRGVYVNAEVVPSDDAGRHLLLALAHQVLRPKAIASHHTAALAWALPLDDPAGSATRPVAFTQPLRPAGRSEVGTGFTVALRDLPAEHRVALPSGLLATSLARTAVDVAAVEPTLPAALVVADAAARRILMARVGERQMRAHYTRPQSLVAAVGPLREAEGSAATQFTRQRVNDVLALADPRRESPLESYSFGQMVVHGLPLPKVQVRVHTPEATSTRTTCGRRPW